MRVSSLFLKVIQELPTSSSSSSCHSSIKKEKTYRNPEDNNSSGRDTNRTRLQYESAQLPAETTCPYSLPSLNGWKKKKIEQQAGFKTQRNGTLTRYEVTPRITVHLRRHALSMSDSRLCEGSMDL